MPKNTIPTYKINTSALKNPIRVDSNTVKAELCSGQPVEFCRYLEGWHAQLSITVDGVLIHHTEAGTEEIQAFETLMQAAFEAQSNSLDRSRCKALALSKACGLF